MKNFLKPTVFKIIITTVIVLTAFGGNMLYSRTAYTTESGPQTPNLAINVLNITANTIFYPVRFVMSLFDLNANEIEQNSFLTPIFSLIFFLLVAMEAYLISSVISLIINRK